MLYENKQDIIFNKIGKGDWVQLRYNGNRRVPKWLSCDWAKVIKWNNRGNLIVQPKSEAEGFTRTIQPIDIMSYKSEEEFSY